MYEQMVKLIVFLYTALLSTHALAADFSLKPGRTFSFDGINCHSASLQAAGVIKYPSHVTDDEIQFIFETQCEQVPRNEARAIGITGGGTLFSHSFFYIEPNKVFQKKSLQKKDSYQILKGHPVRGAKYFMCKAEPSDCSDARVTRVKKLTDQIGIYYAGLLLSADDMNQRDIKQKQLVQLQKMTSSLRGLPSTCRRAVQRIALRQDSLRAVSDRLSGARFFLGQIPRSVGRD
jgi:hypothetical protein